jgi:hypothetical protein
LQQIRRKLGVHRSLEALWSKPIQRAMIARSALEDADEKAEADENLLRDADLALL